VPASSRKLQPCRKSNAHCTRVFGLLQPLPGTFQSNDVPSGSLPVTTGHLTSFPVMWLPPPASCSLVGSKTQYTQVFGLVQPLPRKFRLNDINSGSLPVTRGQVTSFSDMTAFCCELQPCRKSNAQYKRVFGLLQPIPGDFRSNDITSGHQRSRDIISCHVTASCNLQPCRKSNAQYTQVFRLLQPLPGDFSQMTSLPGHFLSPEVTSRHFLSCDCLLLRATALYEVKHTVYTRFWPSTATSRWLPVKWRHFLVTSCYQRSHHVISSHVTASSYELQPCRKWNTAYSSFRSFIATSRWLPIKWRHFLVTSGHLRPRDVIFCHVTASSCELQPCRKWNAQYTRVFVRVQPPAAEFRSYDVTFESLPVTWGHVTSFPVMLQPPPVSYSLVDSETHERPHFSAHYIQLRLTSGEMTSLLAHWVTWGHVMPFSCHVNTSFELQHCRKWNAPDASFQPSTATCRWLPVKWRHFR